MYWIKEEIEEARVEKDRTLEVEWKKEGAKERGKGGSRVNERAADKKGETIK